MTDERTLEDIEREIKETQSRLQKLKIIQEHRAEKAVKEMSERSTRAKRNIVLGSVLIKQAQVDAVFKASLWGLVEPLLMDKDKKLYQGVLFSAPTKAPEFSVPVRR